MWEVEHRPRKPAYWGPVWNSMVFEATVPLSDQIYCLPKSAFGRGEKRDGGGQREREGAVPIISESSYPPEGRCCNEWMISGRTASVERKLAKASKHSSLSPLCLFWRLSSFQEMSNYSVFGKGEAYTDEGTGVTHDVVSLPALHSFNMEKSNSFNLANR